MDVSFLTTVDCDLRVSSVAIRDRALWALHDLFAKEGVSGHVTWFVNENDFMLTHAHQPFLLEAVARGETIGVHDHIDFLDGDWTYGPVREFCEPSRQRVGAWLADNGCQQAVRCHRFGCVVQYAEAYRAVQDLGYTVCSDVVPGDMHLNHVGTLAYDNRHVPLGILPYYHGPDSIADYESSEGPTLQIPLLKASLTAGPEEEVPPENLCSWQRLNSRLVQAWIDGARQLGHGCCVMTFIFHPYELIEGLTGGLRIDPAALAKLSQVIRMMRDEFGAEFLSMEECVAAFG